ncbi:DMT family transporter [Afifella sp. YEN Y35]|uniref:DMT family transporter n=1 Tax=Afifella sp. YEN Y35 TaxID=3388337 RepID=UPI0039DF349F
MSPSHRTGILYALCCLAILSAMPVIADARPEGSSGLSFAIWLTFWQLVAGLPLFIVELRRGAPPSAAAQRPSARTLAIALLTGAMFAVATYMYVVAAKRAGPVSMVIALQAYPLFAILLEAVLLGKRKSTTELGFTALLLAALVYLTTGGTFRVADISWWSAYTLGIPALWAIAHVLLRQVLMTTSITPNQVTVTRLVISGIVLLALQAVIGEPGALLQGFTDPTFQKAAILLGVAYYLELVLWFNAIRHIDVSVASSITVPTPAVTMLITVVVLGGHVETFQILAMVVICVALYGLLFAGRQARRAPSPG